MTRYALQANIFTATTDSREMCQLAYLDDVPAPCVLVAPVPDVEFLHDVLRRLTTPDEVDAPPPPASSAESAPEL